MTEEIEEILIQRLSLLEMEVDRLKRKLKAKKDEVEIFHATKVISKHERRYLSHEGFLEHLKYFFARQLAEFICEKATYLEHNVDRDYTNAVTTIAIVLPKQKEGIRKARPLTSDEYQGFNNE